MATTFSWRMMQLPRNRQLLRNLVELGNSNEQIPPWNHALPGVKGSASNGKGQTGLDLLDEEKASSEEEEPDG